MPVLKEVKQLRSLLGGLSYYWKFLPQMAKGIRPITGILKKKVPSLSLPSEIEMVVRQLLAELAAPPVLVYRDREGISDGSWPFHLSCDARIDGFGRTLEQEQLDGTTRPIVYISRATLESERH